MIHFVIFAFCGFFVAGGGFPAARVYSQYTAMLIKADLEGLLPSL